MSVCALNTMRTRPPFSSLMRSNEYAPSSSSPRGTVDDFGPHTRSTRRFFWAGYEIQ